MNQHAKIEMLVNRTISPSDAMYGGNSAHYFSVGASALENVQNALRIAKIAPRKILDFGCGAGRVTRWLAAAFPEAELEGCDLRPADLEFVSETWSARTWSSDIDATKLSPPSSYDLIWVGSVFTHLSMTNTLSLFDTLSAWLNPGGLLVLTSHGRHAKLNGANAGHYGIPEQWSLVAAEFQLHDFGYADYASSPGYGISLIRPPWWATLVSSRDNLRLISMTEQTWDDHQDVIAVQRR